MDVGTSGTGKLNIQTLQSSSTYSSEQHSSGFSVSICIPPICYGGVPVTGSIQQSEQSFNHNYQSAVGQSGIAAGAGGFDIKVAGNTNLQGGAITSSATPDKNTLQTASLTSTDLDNRQATHSSSSSTNLSYSGASTLATLAQNAISNGLGNLGAGEGLPENGSQSSTTRSVISAGNITITGTGNKSTDAASQQQVASLTSRDAKTANQSLTNTLTLQQAQAVQEQQKTAQENQQAANLAGAAMDGVIGDLAISNQWRTGSPQATLLHGLSGVIQASIGGTNLGSGFASAVVNEQAIGAMSDYLESKGIKRYINGDPSKPNTEYNELMKAGSALVGVATAAALGGNKTDMAAGGHIAKNATEFNALVHDQRLAVLNATKAGKTPRQQQALSDAACALAKCAQGLDPNDPNTAAQVQSQFRGEANTPEAIAARNSLLINGFETRTTLEAVTDTVKYLRALASDDALKAYNGANNLGNIVLNDFKLALQKSGGPQIPDDFGRTDGPNTGGGAAAVVTPTVVLCSPAGLCTIVPPAMGLTSTSPLPSGWTLSQSGGSDNGNSNNGAAPVASGGNASGANGGVAAVGEIGSGVRVYPDGSLRTPDGKFASVSGSPAPGTTAAANYADFLNKNGVNVVGQEMVVNGPLGPRRYDIVVQDAAGNLQGIEIKSGGATKATYQDFTDRFVNQFGAPGAGKLDGKSVTSTITIYVP